jgi:hypothetical protein
MPQSEQLEVLVPAGTAKLIALARPGQRTWSWRDTGRGSVPISPHVSKNEISRNVAQSRSRRTLWYGDWLITIDMPTVVGASVRWRNGRSQINRT